MLNYQWLKTRMHYLLALLPSLSFFKLFNIAISFFSFILKRKKSGQAPVVLSINLTYRCNYSCIMCQKSSITKNVYTDKPQDMNFDALKNILTENAKYICLVRLHGGEPLYYGKILMLIDLLDSLNLKYALITNASLLTSEISKKLMNNCIEISISIDSADKKKYAEIRTPGDLTIVTKNIQYLNQLKFEKKNNTPIINLAVTTFSFNISGLSDLVSYCYENGISSISVSEGMYYNTPKIRDEHLIKHSPQETIVSVNKAKSRARKLKIKLRLASPILNADVSSKVHSVTSKITRCINFYIYAVISPTLDVAACPLSDFIGNIENNSLLEIWNGPEYGFYKARELLKSKKLPKSCRYCNDVNAKTLNSNQTYSYTTLQKERYNTKKLI